METMTKAGVTYTYNKYEVINIINKTIDMIEEWIKKNNYRIKISKHLTDDVTLNVYKNLEKNWKDISKRKMKKIQKYCFWIQKNPTRRRVNTFFNLLSKTFGLCEMENDKFVRCPYIKESLKEEKIQARRREWLKAREESDRLLKLYKEEKGDFYKNKMNFFTKK
jgi:hypothetical protein